MLAEMVIHDTGKIERVSVTIPDNDIPVRPKHKTFCTKFSEWIMDGREVVPDNKAVCTACADEACYRVR